MSSLSLKNYDEHLESSSGSDFCEEEFLAYQSSEPQSLKRNQKCKPKKGGDNFYSKVKVRKEDKEKTNHSLGDDTDGGVSKPCKVEKNVNSKNIMQLQQNVIDLTKRCKKLGIHVGDPDTNEKDSRYNYNEIDSSEEEEVEDKCASGDSKNTPSQHDAGHSHKKLKKQRVGGGTGNTKCHKKNSKKEQVKALGNMTQFLEKLLAEHQNQEHRKERGRTCLVKNKRSDEDK